MAKRMHWTILATTILTTSCGISEAEKRQQLANHMGAYARINVGEHNYRPIKKSIPLLLKTDKSNAFAEIITAKQRSVLESALKKASKVEHCVNERNMLRTNNLNPSNAESLAQSAQQVLACSIQQPALLTYQDIEKAKRVKSAASVLAAKAKEEKRIASEKEKCRMNTRSLITEMKRLATYSDAMSGANAEYERSMISKCYDTIQPVVPSSLQEKPSARRPGDYKPIF